MSVVMKNFPKEYWRKQLAGEIPILNLPLDFPRPATEIFSEGHTAISLGKEAIYRLAKQWEMEPYLILYAAFHILLVRYSSQEDIVIGFPADTPGNADTTESGSPRLRILPLRNNAAGEKTAAGFAREVSDILVQALVHAEYSWDELLQTINFNDNGANQKLFHVIFSLPNPDNHSATVSNNDFRFQSTLWDPEFQYDLALEVGEPEQGFVLNFYYNAKLFIPATIQTMTGHYRNILESIIRQPGIRLAEIEMLSPAERDRILLDFNNTKAPYPKHLTIHRVFEEQAAKTPQEIAVIFQGQTLTYQALNEKANQLARSLRARNMGPDKIAGVLAERSLEMMIGILGILKAGGAYLPISPDYPTDRIKYMLENSGTRVLLTQTRFLDKVEFDGDLINLEEPQAYDNDDSNLEAVNQSGDMAYVIYTSGSTGKPKGVVIEHYSVINRILWMQKKYPITRKDVILQKTPFTFDVSVWELFWWFFEGARVCFLAPGGEKEPDAIIAAIARERISTMHFVPSMLNVFLDYIENRNDLDRLASLRQVFASGEALHLTQVNKFNKLLHVRFGAELNNLYGPTEATVDVSFFDCSTGEELTVVPIGKPIDNIELYVLDSYRRIQPVGVPGELYIAGDGLARGYLNRPDLTSERFVPNPFHPGARMYRTGDLAKWLPDGNIEYLGRMDHQVKIRGFRIELGEIEAELLKISSIKEVVVIDREDDNGNKQLVAYMVTSGELAVAELKNRLARTLPDYMIPSYFVRLAQIPLSPNGKADRKSLPKPEIPTANNYVAPETVVERTLVGIWQNFFGNEKIGTADDFYSLGGDSIKAIQLISLINACFSVQLTLAEFFQAKSIQSLAQVIESKCRDGQEGPPLLAVPERAYYPTTFVQKAMFDPKNNTYPTRYNLARADLLEGNLDVPRLEQAFIRLIERHEVFRTSFHWIDGEYVQKIAPQVSFRLDWIQCDEAQAQQIMRQFATPFDLGKSPILKAAILQVDTGRYYLLTDMHHIIYDAVSMEIFDGELWQLYRGVELPPLMLQYKDYAVWQDNLLHHGMDAEYEKYWRNQLQGFQFTQLPIDQQDGAMVEYSQERLIIEQEKYHSLHQLCNELKITKAGLIIAVFQLRLAGETGQNDVAVGLRVSNRFGNALNPIFGCFLEKVVLRSVAEDRQTARDFVMEVNHTLMEAIDHALYPYDLLNAKIREHEDITNPELFNIIINYTVADAETSGVLDSNIHRIKSFHVKEVFSKYDINFKIFSSTNHIELQFKYKSNLYSRERMARIIKGLQLMIDMILADSHCVIGDLQRQYSNIAI
jgi:tyrocidine synthetase-3